MFKRYPDAVKNLQHCDFLTTSRAVSLWREPTERAWSAYRYMQVQYPCLWDDVYLHWWPDPRKEWDAYLAELADNRHRTDWSGVLTPQSEFTKGKAEHTRVPWDFGRMAEILDVEGFGHSNASTTLAQPDITPEMQYHLNLVYGTDYRIWEQINDHASI